MFRVGDWSQGSPQGKVNSLSMRTQRVMFLSGFSISDRAGRLKIETRHECLPCARP